MSQAVTHVDAGAAWSGVGDAQTLLDLFVPSCRRDTAPAMIFEDGVEVSRADLLALTEQFAGYLRERVDPGEVVAIMVANRAEYMIAHLAVCAVRATLVSINPTAKAARHAPHPHRFRGGAGHRRRGQPGAHGRVARRRPGPSRRRRRGRGGTGRPRCLHGERGSVRPRLDGLPPATTSRTSTTPRAPRASPKGCMLDHGWWLRSSTSSCG